MGQRCCTPTHGNSVSVGRGGWAEEQKAAFLSTIVRLTWWIPARCGVSLFSSLALTMDIYNRSCADLRDSCGEASLESTAWWGTIQSNNSRLAKSNRHCAAIVPAFLEKVATLTGPSSKVGPTEHRPCATKRQTHLCSKRDVLHVRPRTRRKRGRLDTKGTTRVEDGAHTPNADRVHGFLPRAGLYTGQESV